jgi:hypothetical protein
MDGKRRRRGGEGLLFLNLRQIGGRTETCEDGGSNIMADRLTARI